MKKNTTNISFGSRDVGIGNSYFDNPDGTNICGPVVNQTNNAYPKNNGENRLFAAVVYQTNNTYLGELRGNENALNPTIHQNGNVYPSTSGNNSIIGTVVNRSGNSFHPFQDHHKKSSSGIAIGMVKRKHEDMERIIFHYLHINQPTSKRCANGITDLRILNQIDSLHLEIKTQIAQLKTLKQINHHRKIICDTIENQCSKQDYVRKWIANSRPIVMQNTEQSRKRWKSLQTC